MMHDNQQWIKIYTSSLEHEVEIIQGMLKEHDIEAIIINKKDSSYLFGEVELYVNATDAFHANQLITNPQSE